jgi:hypothetical protein
MVRGACDATPISRGRCLQYALEEPGQLTLVGKTRSSRRAAAGPHPSASVPEIGAVDDSHFPGWYRLTAFGIGPFAAQSRRAPVPTENSVRVQD